MEKRGFDDPTLGDALYDWLNTYKKHSLKPASYGRLITSFYTMEKYSILDMPLHSIKCSDVQKYVNELADSGYAMTTIRNMFALLTAYLKHAFTQGDIGTPVYIGVKMPSYSNVKKEPKRIEAYSEMEQQKLMRVLRTLKHRDYAAAILMLEEGLRIGEALALTWDDILWDKKAIRINKTLVMLGGYRGKSFVQNSPKTKTSNRVIPLSGTAYEILEELHDCSDDLDGYIFRNDSDPEMPVLTDTVRKHLETACKKAGVPYKGNHIFRHTFATNCYHKGCDIKILSKMLGHADVSITYNTYIHLFGDALEDMRKIIG